MPENMEEEVLLMEDALLIGQGSLIANAVTKVSVKGFVNLPAKIGLLSLVWNGRDP